MNDKAGHEVRGTKQAQILKGLAELALLSALQDGPRYGLEIFDGLRGDAGLNLAEGTIYPLLYRLERAKLVQAKWRLDGQGIRPRKYYVLTGAGRKELAAQLADWHRISASLGAYLNRGRAR